MRLNHNLASLNIYRGHIKTLDAQSTALERISSGYKINSAKDNPNVIGSSEKMRIQIRGLQMAERNIQDGVSMMQTADGALGNISEMLIRLKELVVKAGTDTNTDEEKNIIKNEISTIIDGIDNIADNTEFNGVKLLNGSLKDVNGKDVDKIFTQIGPNVGEKIDIPLQNVKSSNLKDLVSKLEDLKNGVNLPPPAVNTGDAISVVDSAIDQVTKARNKYGALSNRFDSTFDKVREIHDTIVSAESKVRDADIAEEMIEYTKDNILIDAGHAMLAQTNKFPQDILRILENIRSR
ncbi:flagellin N-terminal helical domain-containing protein [Clostridium sp. JNZ J1-5]